MVFLLLQFTRNIGPLKREFLFNKFMCETIYSAQNVGNFRR